MGLLSLFASRSLTSYSRKKSTWSRKTRGGALNQAAGKQFD
jgi:hypothetical protein